VIKYYEISEELTVSVFRVTELVEVGAELCGGRFEGICLVTAGEGVS
jgi:hypothetical protein